MATLEEVIQNENRILDIKNQLKTIFTNKGFDMSTIPFTQYHTLITAAQKWIYGDGSDGDVVYNSSRAVSLVQAKNITVKNGVTLLPTARLIPMILKATESITVEGGAILSADGFGYTSSEAGNNKFNLAQSTQGVAGSIGISGGGSSGNAGRAPRGGQPVAVNTFLSYIAQHYIDLLADNDLDIIPLFGGGGGSLDVNNTSYSYGGGCILLVAPTINFAGHAQVRGLPGAGGSWNGGGGGGGGWFGMFGKTLNFTGTADAVGGGGGGGAWDSVGTAGSWQNGGASTGRGFTRGGAGGGSTALNADGGTPGAGGSGTQYQGDAGTATGIGGAGGNETGSNRGGRGGSGGGAGKISWLQVG